MPTHPISKHLKRETTLKPTIARSIVGSSGTSGQGTQDGVPGAHPDGQGSVQFSRGAHASGSGGTGTRNRRGAKLEAHVYTAILARSRILFTEILVLGTVEFA